MFRSGNISIALDISGGSKCGSNSIKTTHVYINTKMLQYKTCGTPEAFIDRI